MPALLHPVDVWTAEPIASRRAGWPVLLTGSCEFVRILSMPKKSAEGDAFTELVLEVFRLNGLLLAAGDRMAGPSGLTSARWQVLGVVDHAPVSVAHVSRIMGLTRQSVQTTADALERDGFVEYRDNPHHRRAKLIALTEKGRIALRQVEARQAIWADRTGKAVGEEALRTAVEGLRRARQRLEEGSAGSTRMPGREP
ncbi:MarR family winged helix-turn-helix transcriptional regulator [Tautonia plasticadhaerens]|uniref:MarR family winged helix-turn-helix transcriptional regulator n=1 Tax=Tautonia plasticadhaerens TaxID=2527974 RepID=UPI0018D23B6B|nr:MarR family winged helix-turn-helix transcriptional regulator [Tautonia plasticadhaerens]